MLLFFFFLQTNGYATVRRSPFFRFPLAGLAFLPPLAWRGVAWLGLAFKSQPPAEEEDSIRELSFFLSLLGICSNGTGHRELPVIITEKNKQTSCKTFEGHSFSSLHPPGAFCMVGMVSLFFFLRPLQLSQH